MLLSSGPSSSHIDCHCLLSPLLLSLPFPSRSLLARSLFFRSSPTSLISSECFARLCATALSLHIVLVFLRISLFMTTNFTKSPISQTDTRLAPCVFILSEHPFSRLFSKYLVFWLFSRIFTRRIVRYFTCRRLQQLKLF